MPGPMKERAYRKWISQYGWYLKKAGSGDWKLYNAHDNPEILFIKITHPGKEVPYCYVKKTEQALKDAGLE